MAPRRQHFSSRGIGKRPAETFGNEVKRKAQFDSTRQKCWYSSALDIEYLFVTLEWLPIVKLIKPVYPTLVHAFYANAEVYIDLYIVCTLRGFSSFRPVHVSPPPSMIELMRFRPI